VTGWGVLNAAAAGAVHGADVSGGEAGVRSDERDRWGRHTDGVDDYDNRCQGDAQKAEEEAH
jgi:hypothetical protein